MYINSYKIYVCRTLSVSESVFSIRPFKQRPTNSSQPLCSGRKTRRSHSVKFESVALEQESQGQSAAVEKKKGLKTLYLYVFYCLCTVLIFLIKCYIGCLLESLGAVAQPDAWERDRRAGLLRRKEKLDNVTAALRHLVDTENKRCHGFCWKLACVVLIAQGDVVLMCWDLDDFYTSFSHYGCIGNNESERDEIKQRLEDVDISSGGSWLFRLWSSTIKIVCVR